MLSEDSFCDANDPPRALFVSHLFENCSVCCISVLLWGAGGVELAQDRRGRELASHSFLLGTFFLAPHLASGGSAQRFGGELHQHVDGETEMQRPSGLSSCEGSMAEGREESSGLPTPRPVLFHCPFSNLGLVSSSFINWESYSKLHLCACGLGGSLFLWRRPRFGVTHQLG